MPFYRGVPVTFKAQKPKDYSETPQTLGQHLKKRRRELGLLQRDAAERMGIDLWTYRNWESDATAPVAARFRPIIQFLGYDPSPEPKTLADRLAAKQRALGATLSQVAQQLGWDPGSLRRYVDGRWRLSPERAAKLDAVLLASTEERMSIRHLKRRR